MNIRNEEERTMTTAEMKNIKLGDHVVYVAAAETPETPAKEYNAMALGAPVEGYNSGAKLGSLFLNLIYLNELAVPVKVLAAPLVGSAVDDEHVAAVGAAAAKHDPAWHDAKEPERAAIVAANVEFVKAHPRSIGWKPMEDGAEVAALKLQIADLTALVESQQAILNQKPTETPAQPVSESQNADIGKPSANDLDAVAEEQKAAQDTSDEPAPAIENEPVESDAEAETEAEAKEPPAENEAPAS
jgi:hypothetical protein